jgi:CRISPR-associated protein Cas1
VDDGKLIIKDGRDWEKEPEQMTFKPKFIDYDQIILYGHTGNLTLSAIKWVMKHKIPIHVLDYDGTSLTTMNPPQSKIGSVRLAQYEAYKENRIEIAKKFIETKIIRTKDMFEWLLSRYPNLDDLYKLSNFDKTLVDLQKAETVREIMVIEGIVAHHFWKAIKSTFSDKFGFEKRGYGRTNRPLGAVDPINALFNYGYAILEGICRKAVNSANLDPYIGFLHETRPMKEPLVYDLQEPFRWIIDMTIIQALEKKKFHKKDFIRTEDYIIRLRPDAVSKLIDEIDSNMSQTVKYKGKNHQWDKIIQMKGMELSNYLIGKNKGINLMI